MENFLKLNLFILTLLFALNASTMNAALASGTLDNETHEVDHDTPKVQASKKVWRASLGLGFILKNNFRRYNIKKGRSSDPLAQMIPLIRARYKKLKYGEDGLSFQFMSIKKFLFFLNAKRTGHEYEAVGMSKRRRTWFSGLRVTYKGFKFKFFHDLEGLSEGSFFDFSWGQRKNMTEKFGFNYRVGVRYLSQSYVDYYFGVKDTEVSGDRTSYNGKSTLNAYLSFLPTYNIAPDFHLISGIIFKRYGNNIHSSPTVAEAFELAWLFGVSYRL